MQADASPLFGRNRICGVAHRGFVKLIKLGYGTGAGFGRVRSLRTSGRRLRFRFANSAYDFILRLRGGVAALLRWLYSEGGCFEAHYFSERYTLSFHLLYYVGPVVRVSCVFGQCGGVSDIDVGTLIFLTHRVHTNFPTCGHVSLPSLVFPT